MICPICDSAEYAKNIRFVSRVKWTVGLPQEWFTLLWHILNDHLEDAVPPMKAATASTIGYTASPGLVPPNSFTMHGSTSSPPRFRPPPVHTSWGHKLCWCGLMIPVDQHGLATFAEHIGVDPDLDALKQHILLGALSR